MPTDIIMPQMGESIVEGTITKWLKKPGDKVQRDEPLFEISTDKVDAEIPAPASGVLQEIKVTEGTTVGVNTVVGTIAVDGEAAAPPPKATPAPPPQAKEERKEEKKPVATAALKPPASAPPAQESADEEARSSPLVRKIAREHSVNLSQVSGTGLGGRITKQDIMAFIERPSAAPAALAPATAVPPLQLPIPATSSP
jgi:pyruvate dehydrogenase E2 component (dihydrolipoamide acetyltransferase)